MQNYMCVCVYTHIYKHFEEKTIQRKTKCAFTKKVFPACEAPCMTVSQQASAEITCQTWSVIHRLCSERLAIISHLHPDLPKDCKQAWMSSSQLAPLVRCPRAMVDLPGALWVGVGLWNLWGRTGGETLDLELHPGATLLKKIQHKYGDAVGSLSYWKCIYLWIQEHVGLHEPVLELRLWNNAWIYLFNCHKKH